MTELRFIGDWSLYLGVPAALLAGVAVWLLYRRELRARGGWLSYLLPGLRAAAAVLLVLMLTGPVLHHRKVVGQLARILVLVDGSESMSVRDEQMTPERKLLCAVQMGFLSETLLPEDLWGALKGLGRAQRRDVGEGAGEGADQEKGYHQAAALLRDDLETTYQHLQQIEFDYSLLTITPKGTILYEYWEGINGSKISDFTRSRKYREAPSGTRALTQFEGPHDWKDNYGSRISGFLYPPETGEYTFWITSDDEGELYLSDNDNPSGKKRIGWVRDHAPQESWEQSGEQKSQPIRLEGGRRYYIEAISKEGGGQDHLRVGWRRPDGTMQRPIPGEYLSAYPRGQSDQFYMASQESILREFRLQLLEPAKDLERKQVTKDTKSYIQNYTTLTRKAGDWQGQLRQYFERWAGRLSQSGRPEVREAVNRFEQLNRWQRTEGLLLGGEAPLLSELIEHHDVELFTFTEKSLQPNWRGQAGEGSLSEALPEVMAGEPTASATNLSLGLRAAVHQRRAEEAATERAADPEEAGATRLAVVLFTDGRHNYGESPIQPAKLCGSREIPIFTVGMGAVKEPEDLAVVRVEHPRSLFHQDRVKGRIVLKDEMPAGKAFSLRIVCGGKLLWSRELKTTGAKQRTIDYDFPLEQFLKEELKKQPRQLSFRSFPLEMRAAVSGAGAADRQPENNARSFRLRAIFQKNRILILDGRPRWEYRYLRNLFERDEKWEVTALVFDPSAAGGGIQRGDKGHQFPNQRELLYGYDLILLGDFPETALQPTEWGWIRDSVGKRGAGLIFIDGRREHLRKYEKSPLAELLPVVWSRSGEHKDAISLRLTKQGRLRLTEQGEHLAALTLSTEDISNSQVWSNLKAPHWLAGIRPLPGAEVLVEAVVGPTEAVAALVYRRCRAGKALFAAFDESWRWLYRVGDKYHGRYWNQVANLIMARPYAVSDRFISLDAGALLYVPGERAEIRARVRDTEGRQVTEGIVKAHLLRDGKQVSTIPLEADKEAGEFRGRTAALEEGDYEVKIEVPGYPESQMPARAEFYVQEAKKGELTELSCDGALLREIAEGAGGNFLREEEARDLIEQLKPLSKGKVIQHDTVLWQSYWWFAVVILLLTVEWLLRKWAGFL